MGSYNGSQTPGGAATRRAHFNQPSWTPDSMAAWKAAHPGEGNPAGMMPTSWPASTSGVPQPGSYTRPDFLPLTDNADIYGSMPSTPAVPPPATGGSTSAVVPGTAAKAATAGITGPPPPTSPGGNVAASPAPYTGPTGISNPVGEPAPAPPPSTAGPVLPWINPVMGPQYPQKRPGTLPRVPYPITSTWGY